MSRRITRIIARFELYADRPWYGPLLAALAALDLFVVVIPTDALVIGWVLLNPRKWLASLFWSSFGSALGALALGFAVRYLGFHRMVQTAHYDRIVAWIENHGSVGLSLVATSPLPQQPAVVLCALTGMSLAAIALAVLVGRGLKYGAYVILTSRFPQLLERFPFARSERQALQEAEAELRRERAGRPRPE